MPMIWKDDQQLDHPKYVRLSDGAYRLADRALIWSCQPQTLLDYPPGFVPHRKALELGLGREELIGELTENPDPSRFEAGIWEPAPGGYLIHAWSEWQKRAEDHEGGRAGMTARARAQRIAAGKARAERARRDGGGQFVPVTSGAPAEHQRGPAEPTSGTPAEATSGDQRAGSGPPPEAPRGASQEAIAGLERPAPAKPRPDNVVDLVRRVEALAIRTGRTSGDPAGHQRDTSGRGAAPLDSNHRPAGPRYPVIPLSREPNTLPVRPGPQSGGPAVALADPAESPALAPPRAARASGRPDPTNGTPGLALVPLGPMQLSLALQIGEELGRLGGLPGGRHRSEGFHRVIATHVPEELVRRALSATREAAERREIRGDAGGYFAGTVLRMAKTSGIAVPITRTEKGA